jgi:LCP family protein required for cell wall assembly
MSVTPSKEVIFVSIPANLYVKMDDKKVHTLSEAYSNGGIAFTLEAVRNLLGIKIPFHITASYASYESLISRIGEIKVEVHAPIQFEDDTVDPPVRVDIQPGDHTFDSKSALQYMRYQGEDETGSMVIRRQQEVLMAVLRGAFSNEDYNSVRRLVRDVKPDIKTNLTLVDLYELARIFHENGLENVNMLTLPTTAVLDDGLGYVQPKIIDMEEMIARFIRGTDLLTASDINVAVFNGNGERLLANKTANYLRARDFVVNEIANAETFDYSNTYIIPLTDISKAHMLKSALPEQPEAIIALPDEIPSHYEALLPYTPEETDLLLIAGQGFDVNE